jgi:hypothetical protein
MKDAQKPDHVSLNTLINYLRDGRFVIPDFQREFEWKPWDIRELMRSIFLDYYIGSLLLWKGKSENFLALSCEPVYGHQGDEKPEYIVLDGQKRLTAIYYAFLAPDVPLPNRSNRFFYFVHVDKFMAEEYDEAFGYEWLTRRWAKVLADKEAQYASHLFPFSVIGATGWELPNWVQGYEAFWKGKATEAETFGDVKGAKLARNHAENAKLFGEHLQGITGQYQISYIELDKDLEVDKVCDIFTQINSRGIRLDVFDLVNALLKPKGLQLKKMWRDAAPRLDDVDTEQLGRRGDVALSRVERDADLKPVGVHGSPWHQRRVGVPETGPFYRLTLGSDARDGNSIRHGAICHRNHRGHRARSPWSLMIPMPCSCGPANRSLAPISSCLLTRQDEATGTRARDRCSTGVAGRDFVASGEGGKA